MLYAPAASKHLDDDLQQVDEQGVIVLALDDLRDLVVEPELDPFTTRRSPEQAGVVDLATTLASKRRLPAAINVRIALPAGAPDGPPIAEAEAAMHRRAAYLATVSWRQGIGIKSMGRSQAPIGAIITAVSGAVAYGAAALAVSVSGVARVFLALLAGLCITIAWVVSWMVVESWFLDWRPMARLAQAYDVLSKAPLEVVREDAR